MKQNRERYDCGCLGFFVQNYGTLENFRIFKITITILKAI